VTALQFEPMNDPCWQTRVAGLVQATRWPATPGEAIQAGRRLGHGPTMVRMILAAAEERRSLWFGGGRWRVRDLSAYLAREAS
jgi:hypothetical protein